MNGTVTAVEPFVIARHFAAPRELLWHAFTDPVALPRWWGPKGVQVTRSTLDFRPGGRFHYAMTGNGGGETWGRFVFREIVAPRRLVFVNSFSDPDGELAPPPFPGNWPVEFLTTIDFTPENGGTRLTIIWVPVAPTEAERATFDAGRESMTVGWSGSFEKLDAVLGALSGQV